MGNKTHTKHHTARRTPIGLITSIGVLVTVIAVLGACSILPSLRPASTHTESTQPAGFGLQTGLPGRATRTPNTSNASDPAPPQLPTALATPLVTSPFSFPTRTPTQSVGGNNCTTIFPIESIEAIRFGETTTTQLEAAFGRADSVGGRPTTYRFVEQGCVLRVSIGMQTAMEAELAPYGSLDWLLTRYGPPDAVGISQGNLVLLMPGQTVLLYPAQGLIATFDGLPDELTRASPINTLYVRPAYETAKQIARLNLAVIDNWNAPLR